MNEQLDNILVHETDCPDYHKDGLTDACTCTYGETKAAILSAMKSIVPEKQDPVKALERINTAQPGYTTGWNAAIKTIMERLDV